MKILKMKCPHCGKVLESLYEKQLESNFKYHLKKCEKRVKENEDKKN